jgi:opacity protein-like surface antigen
MKKYMSLRLLSILFCSVSSAQLALAAGSSEFYVGADLLSTQFSGDDIGKSSIFAPKQTFEDSDRGYGLHVGFQFNHWFAVEMGYTDFGVATDRFYTRSDMYSIIVTPNSIQTLDAKGITLNNVFNYHFDKHFSVLAVLGVASLNYKNTLSGGFSEVTGSLPPQRQSLSDQGLVYGIGATYAFTDAVALRTDLRRHEVGDFKLDSASLGLEYSF